MLLISVGGPNDSSANFYATSNIVNGRVISIPFKTFGVESDRIRWIKAEYSLDGGGQWCPAVAHSETITTNLAVSSWPTGTAYTYAWDTFASGLFGRSDNVVFRITAYSQSPALSPNIAGTYRYTDSVAGPFQRPFASATTYPFRVRGTQVQVFDEVVQSGNEVQGAFVYRLPKNGQTAMVMGSQSTNIAFESDQSGYLNGRDQLSIADELLATLPVTQTYRLTPQIYFPDEVSTVRAALSNSHPTDTLSIELWLRPLSPDGDLLMLGDDMALFYRTITDTAAATTTLTLKIGEDSVSTSNENLLDGRIHQMALTWASSQDQNNTICYIDGRFPLTGAPLPCC